MRSDSRRVGGSRHTRRRGNAIGHSDACSKSRNAGNAGPSRAGDPTGRGLRRASGRPAIGRLADDETPPTRRNGHAHSAVVGRGSERAGDNGRWLARRSLRPSVLGPARPDLLPGSATEAADGVGQEVGALGTRRRAARPTTGPVPGQHQAGKPPPLPRSSRTRLGHRSEAPGVRGRRARRRSPDGSRPPPPTPGPASVRPLGHRRPTDRRAPGRSARRLDDHAAVGILALGDRGHAIDRARRVVHDLAVGGAHRLEPPGGAGRDHVTSDLLGEANQRLAAFSR